MIFRILKNEDHFIVQKKWLCFWLNLINLDWEKKPKFHLFKYLIKNNAKYSTLLSAEQAVITCRKYCKEKRRHKSKYNVVKSKVCTKLYNEINKDE